MRVHEGTAAIILLKIMTLTFENLFYLTCRRGECGFVNKLVETRVLPTLVGSGKGPTSAGTGPTSASKGPTSC